MDHKGVLIMKIAHKRLYEQIIHEIETQFIQGKINVGDKLPAERELAEDFGVSRGSLRDAFRILESQGIIETRHGGGRTLIKEPSANTLKNQAFLNMIRHSKVIDLLEAREIMELGMLDLVANRASPIELEALETQLITEQKMVQTNTYQQSDFNFHYALADLSNNEVMIHFIKLNLDVIEQIRKENFNQTKKQQDSIEEHLNIVRALKRGHLTEAKTHLIDHLHNIKNRFNSQ